MAESDRQTLVKAFDREIDPIAEYATTFDEVDIDVFDMFLKEWAEFMGVQIAIPLALTRTTSNGSSDANWRRRGTPDER